MEPVELFGRIRSGVAQIVREVDREYAGSGSAFLVKGGMITCSHVIRSQYEVAGVRFTDTPEGQLIRLHKDTIDAAVGAESPRELNDYAYLKLSEDEFAGRHRFEFSPYNGLRVGQKIAFLLIGAQYIEHSEVMLV